MGNLLFWLGIGAAQKGAGSKPIERRHWVASLIVGTLLALLIGVGMFFLLVSQKWSGARDLVCPRNGPGRGLALVSRYLLTNPRQFDILQLKRRKFITLLGGTVAACTGRRSDRMISRFVGDSYEWWSSLLRKTNGT
jgi:hypothetical protein